MYKERILSNYKNPRNNKEPSSSDYQTTEVVNHNCGDEISGHVLIDDDGFVKDIRFTGDGCAISIATASILSQEMKGKRVDNISMSEYDKDEVLDILGIEISPMRLKCALLARDAYVQSVD